METEECEPSLTNQNSNICTQNVYVENSNNRKKSKPYFDNINLDETTKIENKDCFWTNWNDWTTCNGNCSKVLIFVYLKQFLDETIA